MNRSLSAFLLILVAGLTNIPTSQAQFENLVQHLPEDANTLMLFNMEEILATPLATSQNWKSGEDAKFSSGLMIVPPQTLHLAMAAQMDIELMQPHWHASVMDLSEEPSMLTVTERYGGNVDKISGQDAAVLPNNTVVCKVCRQDRCVADSSRRSRYGDVRDTGFRCTSPIANSDADSRCTDGVTDNEHAGCTGL